MIWILSLSLSGTVCGQIQRPEADIIPQDRFLVHAKAISVINNSDGSQRSDFLIDRVYLGEDKLKGKRFQLFKKCAKPSFLPPIRISLSEVRVGEMGLWWLIIDAKSGGLSPELRDDFYEKYNIQLFPVRRVIKEISSTWASNVYYYDEVQKKCCVSDLYYDRMYQEGLRWASAIRAVHRAKSNKARIILLKQYVSPESPPMVLIWAIRLLSKLQPTEIKEYRRKMMEDTRFSAQIQMALDEEESRIEGKNWQQSPDRLKLLQRWIRGLISNPDYFGPTVGHIENALRDGELDYKTLIRVFQASAVAKARLNKREPLYLISLIESLRPPTKSSKKLFFDYFIQLIQTSHDENIRVASAKTIRGCSPFTAIELATLQELRKSLCDPEIIRILERVSDP